MKKKGWSKRRRKKKLIRYLGSQFFQGAAGKKLLKKFKLPLRKARSSFTRVWLSPSSRASRRAVFICLPACLSLIVPSSPCHSKTLPNGHPIVANKSRFTVNDRLNYLPQRSLSLFFNLEEGRFFCTHPQDFFFFLLVLFTVLDKILVLRPTGWDEILMEL